MPTSTPTAWTPALIGGSNQEAGAELPSPSPPGARRFGSGVRTGDGLWLGDFGDLVHPGGGTFSLSRPCEDQGLHGREAPFRNETLSVMAIEIRRYRKRVDAELAQATLTAAGIGSNEVDAHFEAAVLSPIDTEGSTA